MTGIERLRTLAGAWDEWGLGGTLAETADEIERERAEDCYRMGFDCGTVWRVAADMERHCLGHEGMEDSPVARWARELRGALKSDASDERGAQNPSWHDPADAADVTSDAPKVTRDPAEDVSMSAYDLLPQEDRDAIAWVREHGGLSRVKRHAVLADDGEPLEVGQTVYEVEGTGHAYKVVGIRVGNGDPLTPTVVTCDVGDGTSEHFLPSQLTHTKPEPPDSWDALWDDIEDCAVGYESFMRRCRALAERERGE